MGVHARLSVEASDLTELDAVQLAKDGLIQEWAGVASISGFATRNGQVIPFTLDTTDMAPEVYGVAPEQIAMVALLLASFIAPLLRVLG